MMQEIRGEIGSARQPPFLSKKLLSEPSECLKSLETHTIEYRYYHKKRLWASYELLREIASTRRPFIDEAGGFTKSFGG